MQTFLDKWLKENGGKIDYIHGTDTLKSLVANKGGIGFILPDMNKKSAFPYCYKGRCIAEKNLFNGTRRR